MRSRENVGFLLPLFPPFPPPAPRPWELGASPCAHSQEAPLNSVVQGFYWGFTESRACD